MKKGLLILICLFIPSLSYGQDFNKVEKNGVPAVATLKVMPKSFLKEWNKLERAMKKSRLALMEAIRKSRMDKNTSLKLRGDMVDLNKKLESIVENQKIVNNHLFTNLTELYNDLKNVEQNCNKNYSKLAHDLSTLKDLIENILNDIEELKRKTWGIGLTFSSSLDYGVDGEELVPLNSLGLTSYWSKDNLFLFATISVGLNVKDVALSWSFVPSVEYKMSNSWLLGPVMSLSQDLGDMEGADKMMWNFGGRLRYMTSSWSLSTAPIMVGIRGKRGFGGNDPTWSTNLSGMLFFDLYLM